MRPLSWYLKRLRSMSLREAVARTGDLAAMRIQRTGLGLATHVPEPIQFASRRWLNNVASFSADKYLFAADRILAGYERVFELELSAGWEELDWNRDPLTGVMAPLNFGPSLDIHDRERVGDIKYLWERNRHLDLVSLAQAYDLSAERRFLEGLHSRLGSWIRQCPYPLGPNWSSGLESAIRLINWSVVWQLVGGNQSAMFCGTAGASFRKRWLDSIYQHVHFIRSHYSRHSSANNHRIGEAAGVFVASCTWPFWRDFETWGCEALEILVEEAHAQVTADGVDREQTTAYQRFVLEFFLVSILAGRSQGAHFPAEFLDRVRSMQVFLASLMDVGGHLPMIGDGDDGLVLRLVDEPDFCPYRSALATGAVILQDAELASAAERIDDATRWLVGEAEFGHLLVGSTSGTARGIRRSFRDGGYYIIGTAFGGPAEIRMVVDAGPLGYLGIAAHGHADALAVCLSVAGREILVDPGTYMYHGDPRWRAHFRGTRAHNTVTVDGVDQSVQGGKFMWLNHAAAQCVRFEPSRDKDYFMGEHTGYQRLKDPLTHRREIQRTGRVIQITDSFLCSGPHEVEQWWHFSEFCEVRVEGADVLIVCGGVRVRLSLGPELSSINLYRGSEEPIAGWISRRFGVKVPSPSVCASRIIYGNTMLHATLECDIC